MKAYPILMYSKNIFSFETLSFDWLIECVDKLINDITKSLDAKQTWIYRHIHIIIKQ